MRLTSFTDYGLRTLMRLAAEPDRSFTTEELADLLAVSHHHLAKVVRRLVEAGYVTSRRGSQGGVRLRKPAAEITLGAVVRWMEEPYPMVECFRPDGGECTLRAGCRLKARLSRASESFIKDLDQSTLADIAWSP